MQSQLGGQTDTHTARQTDAEYHNELSNVVFGIQIFSRDIYTSFISVNVTENDSV